MALEAAATLLLLPLLSSKPKPGSYLSLRLRTNRFATYRTGLLPPFTILPLPLRRAAVSKEEAAKETESSSTAVTEPPVRIVALVGQGSLSPLKHAPWLDVMLHTAKRLKWVDEGYEMLVFTDNVCQADDESAMGLQRELSRADILIIVAVTNQESVMWIQTNSKSVQNVICFDSSPNVTNKLGGSYVHTERKGSIFDKIVGFSESKKINDSEEVVRTVSEAWERHNSDDIRFCLLVIINAYIRKALQCLNQCSPVDQVCNYRCIASYESPNLEAFSLCVLQKHNCLELDAKIPEKPRVAPMVKFQGKDLCHETAEDLFVGWLGSLNWSWRVVAGQNPAYDQFPCQYQLFYRGKAKGSFWYEPVFQVKTLEGKMVWRRRRYRVKRGKIPGTFYFSVLDNGVVSNEFWTIVDVSDDLGWGLFHYSGAARVAGQSYTGAVLASPDGAYPNDRERGKLAFALEKCGIKEWELYTVDNCSCIDPPLGIPEGSSLHSTIKIKDKKWASV
ncbi:hypothetical protein CMV_020729 [Castanea mollissima]|uniref:VDE lipocalin domain-containing protein n=1 Tax=Castanea mollissima TaxID=60419 RepID=A0A8J4QXK2_9ROSI|nr:hypothetical protein CMV_020729 [Castanea mollissima]